MDVILNQANFVNDKFFVQYSTKKAIFTIVDEEFPGIGTTTTINVVTVLIQDLAADGTISDQRSYIPVIGLGNSELQLVATNVAYRGQRLSKDNMSFCTVTLVE